MINKIKTWTPTGLFALAMCGLYYGICTLVDGQEVTLGILFVSAVAVSVAYATSQYNKGFKQAAERVNKSYENALADAAARLDEERIRLEKKQAEEDAERKSIINGHNILGFDNELIDR